MADKPDNRGAQDPGPGVHVVVHDDPLRAGRTVAEAINGDLIDLSAMAEFAVDQRARLAELRAARVRADELERLRQAAADGDAEADAELAARHAVMSAIASRRLLDDATADRLHELAAELTSLETLALRTRDALRRDEGGEPADDGPAPPLVRAAAAAVRAEEAAVADARHNLDLLGLLAEGDDDEVGVDVEVDVELTHAAEPAGRDRTDAARDEDRGDDPRADEARAREEDELARDLEDGGPELWDPERLTGQRSGADGSVLMPVGVFLFGVFIACIIWATGLPAMVGQVVLVLGLIGALLTRYSIKAEDRDAAAKAEAASTLQLLDDATGADVEGGDEVEEPEPAPPPPEPEVLDPDSERRRREQAVAEAEARLDTAQRAWATIAGPTADAHDVEILVGLRYPDAPHDPVLHDPTLRSILSVLHQRVEDWQRLWGELGREAPPPDEAVVDLVLADLRETAPDPHEAARVAGRTASAATRHGHRVALAEALGDEDLDELLAAAPTEEDLDDRPLVLVNPFQDLGKRRRTALRQRLEDLDPALTVVLVVGAASDVPKLDPTD